MYLFTESSVPSSLVFETTQRPLYEPRIPSSKTNIASSNSDSPILPSSFLSLNNNLLNQGINFLPGHLTLYIFCLDYIIVIN